MTRTINVLCLVPSALLLCSLFSQAAQSAPLPLVWGIKEQRLTVTNNGKVPIQLDKDIKLLPDDALVVLNETTVLPGQTVIVYGACPHHLPLQKEVMFTPMTADGQQEASQTLPLTH